MGTIIGITTRGNKIKTVQNLQYNTYYKHTHVSMIHITRIYCMCRYVYIVCIDYRLARCLNV